MFAVIILKFKHRSFHKEFFPKGGYGIANSVYHDQTDPRGTV